MSEKEPVREYEVGHGKPPKHSRFKPGQSGNPRGRPKGALNFATVLAAALQERVVVTVDGRRKKLSKVELATQQMINKAAKGDHRAMAMMLAEMSKAGLMQAPQASAQLDDEEGYGSADDAAVLEQFLAGYKNKDDVR